MARLAALICLLARQAAAEGGRGSSVSSEIERDGTGARYENES